MPTTHADPLQCLLPVVEIPPFGYAFSYRDGPVEEQGILVMTPGGPRAWKNQCRHLALPLDGDAPGRFFDRDQRHLVCTAHGACYRPDDGVCIAGPCRGSRLRALPLVIRAGVVCLDGAHLGGFFR